MITHRFMLEKAIEQTMEDAVKLLRTQGYPRPIDCDQMAERLERALEAYRDLLKERR